MRRTTNSITRTEQSFDRGHAVVAPLVLTLTRHVAMVKEHQRLVEEYESELDEECKPKYPGSHSEDELEKKHLSLCKMHDKTEQDHNRLSADYAKSLAEFRALAQKLLD